MKKPTTVVVRASARRCRGSASAIASRRRKSRTAPAARTARCRKPDEQLPEQENADDDHPRHNAPQRSGAAAGKACARRTGRGSSRMPVDTGASVPVNCRSRAPRRYARAAPEPAQPKRNGRSCRACADAAAPGFARPRCGPAARSSPARDRRETPPRAGRGSPESPSARRCQPGSCNASHSSSRVNMSSEAKGSSSISSEGSWISARQSEARCCIPPDSCQG